ncbi:MAG: hypothetical protein LBM87_03720 [Ruminococcus sp.]|jgi:hypothetical protein|nr:hypothetical protein [Ruminococcus sp.]
MSTIKDNILDSLELTQSQIAGYAEKLFNDALHEYLRKKGWTLQRKKQMK